MYELSKDSEFPIISKIDPLDYRKKEIGIEVCISLVFIGSSERSEILNFSILYQRFRISVKILIYLEKYSVFLFEFRVQM